MQRAFKLLVSLSDIPIITVTLKINTFTQDYENGLQGPVVQTWHLLVETMLLLNRTVRNWLKFDELNIKKK